MTWTRSSRSSGGWRTMPEPRRRKSVRRRAGWAIGALLLLGALGAAWAPVALAVPGPGAECGAEAAPSGESDPCEDAIGLDLGFLLPLAGIVGLAGVAVLGAAYVVLRRRAAAPLDPEPFDAQEWWRCASCGRSNVVGSARCHACGAWQR